MVDENLESVIDMMGPLAGGPTAKVQWANDRAQKSFQLGSRPRNINHVDGIDMKINANV